MAAKKVGITPATAKYYLMLEDFYHQLKRGAKAQADLTLKRIENVDPNQAYAMRSHMHSIGYGDD